ncbi:MAG: penicillin-binding protein 2 [Candidatus Buchananbacteria bacterium]
MAISFFKNQRGPKQNIDIRIFCILGVIFLIGLAIIVRLFILQIWQGSFYKTMASAEHEVSEDLMPDRGSIYAKEKDQLFPLVTNRDYYLVYAEPVRIKKPEVVAQALGKILKFTEEESADLLIRLSKGDDPYEPIKHKITKQEVDEIKKFNLAGIGFVSENFRFYPEKGIGGHIFGFVGFKDNEKIGQYGLEGYFNKELSGQAGLMKSAKDALGSLITIGSRSVKKAENGSDLILTIDRQIQFFACQKLNEFSDRFGADGGSVIVMKPTGEILAMCSVPDFDPDNYQDVKDINQFNNPAIFEAYEPGSVMKAISMAAGLDSGAVTPETTYNDEGEVKVGGFTIKNSDLKAHGITNMVGILEKSLNTGAIFVEQKVGKEKFKNYLKNFGFGKVTGIQLNKEVAGDLSALDKSGEIYGMTASFGQGIMVTPIQLVAAFGTIANEGKLVKPFVVSEIDKPDGQKQIFSPQVVRQVISPKTASVLTGMLTSVVEHGYGKKAGNKGYYFAGKTGTAQVAAPGGGYGGKTIHTFAGFGPISKPAFVMVTMLNNPKGVRFAEDSSTPLFGQIAQFLLNYYQIPPDY